jgi:hypothetical protein
VVGARVTFGSTVATDGAGEARVADPGGAPWRTYLVEAEGYLSYRGLYSRGTAVTLWPVSEPANAAFVARTSYAGADYDLSLWRPTSDIRLGLVDALAAAEIVSLWQRVAADVTAAATSGDPQAPTLTVVPGDHGGSVPVRLAAPTQAANYFCVARPAYPGYAMPTPHEVRVSLAQARDPDAVRVGLARLMGLNPDQRPGSDGGLLPSERLSLRMRFLRRPATFFVEEIEDEDYYSSATFNVPAQACP